LNKIGVVNSSLIGMNLWLIPQISEHCPNKLPLLLEIMKIWLNWFGLASTLIINLGIVHLWITSVDVIKHRIGVLIGKKIKLSVSNNRKLFSFKVSDCFMKQSIVLELKSDNSYDQYHWWPIIFNVR